MNRASSLQLGMFFSVKSYILANERLTLLRRRKYILLRERCFDVGIRSRRDIMSETREESTSRCYVRKKVAIGKLPSATRETTACVIIQRRNHAYAFLFSSRVHKFREYQGFACHVSNNDAKKKKYTYSVSQFPRIFFHSSLNKL